MSKKDDIILKFKNRIDQGKSLRYKDIKEEDKSLLYAIEKHFGGIFNISKEIGLTENDLVNKYGLTRNINARTLSVEEIKNRLLYLKSIGRLTTNAMRIEFEDYRLEVSIKKIYGSVENALKYFNLQRDRVRVSKSGLIKEIQSFSDQGYDMSYTSMIQVNSKLVYNSTNVFKKGWYAILDDIGIPYHAKRQAYSKDSIRKRLYALKEEFGEINYPIIRKHDGSILYYASENYDNLIEFYSDMGIDPNECMDFSKQTIKGFAFEGVFKEILELMNIEFTYNTYFNSKIRPDFRLRNDVWIDCKLSSWTKSIEDTIEKYTPYCDKLIIVFLRGDMIHTEKYAHDKVEFRKIDYYYPFLKSINRQDIIEKLSHIINNDFLESVTTERSTSINNVLDEVTV